MNELFPQFPLSRHVPAALELMQSPGGQGWITLTSSQVLTPLVLNGPVEQAYFQAFACAGSAATLLVPRFPKVHSSFSQASAQMSPSQ